MGVSCNRASQVTRGIKHSVSQETLGINIHGLQRLQTCKSAEQARVHRIGRKENTLCFYALINPQTSLRPRVANNSGVNKRQITDLVDQSIQINTHCFVVTADNRYILVCGFWDKSFRVYSTETGRSSLLPLTWCFFSILYPGPTV